MTRRTVTWRAGTAVVLLSFALALAASAGCAEAAERLKTVEFFINVSKQQIGANKWYNNTFVMQLPENSISVKSAHIEVFGISPRGTAGGILTYLNDSLLATQTLSGGSETFGFRYIANGTSAANPAGGLYGINGNGAYKYTFSLRPQTTNYNALSAKAVLTYSYDDASATQLQTSRFLVNQSQTATNYISAAWYNSTFFVQLPGTSPSVKSAWLEVGGQSQFTAATNATLNVAFGRPDAPFSPFILDDSASTDETGTYVINVNATNSSGASIYSITDNVKRGYILGLKLTNEVSNNHNAQLYVTYTTTKANQTTYEIFVNSTGALSAANAFQNWTFPVQLFGSNPKVQSAFFEIWGGVTGTATTLDAWNNQTRILNTAGVGMAFSESDSFRTYANASAVYAITDNAQRYYSLDLRCNGAQCNGLSAKLVLTYNFTSLPNQTMAQFYVNSTQGSMGANSWSNFTHDLELPENSPFVHSAFYGMNGNMGGTSDMTHTAALGQNAIPFDTTLWDSSATGTPFYRTMSFYNATNSTTGQLGTPYDLADSGRYTYSVGRKCTGSACFSFGTTISLLYTYSTTTPNTRPKWSANSTKYLSDGGLTYTPGRNYGFQVTWTDADAGDAISNVTFETNLTTGTTALENITKASAGKYTTFTNNTNGVWWVNLTQEQMKAAGTYVFRWYANDTSNNAWNSTHQWTYTVARAAPAGAQSQSPSGTWTETYGTETAVSCALATGDAGTTLSLKRDAVERASGTAPSETATLGWQAAGHAYTCDYPQTANYSAATLDTDTLTISKAAPTLGLTLDGSSASPQARSYANATDVQGSESNGGDAGCTYAYEWNGTAVPAGPLTFPARGHNITYYLDSGCQNYTAAQVERMLNVTRGNVSIDMWLNGTLNGDNSVTYPSAVNATCRINVTSSAQNAFAMERNGTAVGSQSGQAIEYDALLAAAVYNFTCYYAQSENYTAQNRTGYMTVVYVPQDVISNATQAMLVSSAVPRRSDQKRVEAEPFTAAASVTKVQAAVRSMSQSFSLNSVYSRAQTGLRTLPQTLSLPAAAGRVQAATRGVSQYLSDNAAAARVIGAFRSLSQAVSASQAASRIGAIVRALAQPLSAEAASARMYGAARAAAQAASWLSSAGTRSVSVYEAVVSASAGVANAAGRAISAARLTVQSLLPQAASSRIDVALRRLSQQFGAGSAAMRVDGAVRGVAQSLSASQLASRATAANRLLAQALSPDAAASRLAAAFRALGQPMTGSASAAQSSAFARLNALAVGVGQAPARVADAARSLSQAIGAGALASRASSAIRELSQQAGIYDAARYSTEITYNALVKAYVGITGAVGRGLSASRAMAQSLAADALVGRLQSAARSAQQALSPGQVAARAYSTVRSAVQSLSYGAAVDNAFGMIRTLSQSMTANAASARAAEAVRAIAQAADYGAVSARITSAFRTLAQGVSSGSAVSGVVFRLYEMSASAAMSISNGVARVADAVRASAEALSAAGGVQRLLSAGRALSQSLNHETLAVRAGAAFRTLAQQFSAAQAAANEMSRGRLATLGLGLDAVTARAAAAVRAVPQSLSFAGSAAARLPEMLYQKVASLGMSLTTAAQRIAAAGRLATGAFSFADASSRIAGAARSAGQALNAGAVASRAAEFSRSVQTGLAWLFGWFLRMPTWFYSSRPTCEAAGYYWCSGSCAALECSVQHNVTYVTVAEGALVHVNETNTNVTVSFVSNATLGSVGVETWAKSDTFASTTLADDTDTQAVKYFNVTANSTLNATVLQWLAMRFEYTDSELSSAGITEGSLALYVYSADAGTWVQLTNGSAGVFATGIDATAKCAWVNKTNMSLYAIGGLYVDGHACSAAAECQSGVCCSSACQASCASPAPSPSSGSGGGGGAIIPPSEPDVKYRKIAVLREAVPGQAVVVGVEVKNAGAVAHRDMRLSVSGVPAGWVSTSVDVLSVQPSEAKGFNVVVTPPADAAPGDYKVALKLKDAAVQSENFFIMRVRSVPADYGKPVVTRQVSIDRDSGQTSVDIVVNNAYGESERIDVVEDIPKELASSADVVEFGTRPSEIVRKDPIVMWSITGMAAGETRTLSYSVPKVLDEFTPYIYWPLRQLDVVSAASPSTMRLAGFAMPALAPGSSSAVSFRVKNLDSAPHVFTFDMELPGGWGMSPGAVKETIEAGQEREFRVLVTPPAGAEAGSYVVRAAFGWDGTYVVKEYVAETAAFGLPLVLAGAAIAVFAGGAWYGYRLSRGRAQPRGRTAMDEKLGRIRSAIAAPRAQAPMRVAFESELKAVAGLRAGMTPAAERARPARSAAADGAALLQKIRSSLGRRNRPWRDYWG